MNRPYLLGIAMLVNGSLLAGCTTPVPVASHSLGCEVSDELLGSRCEQPKPVAEDATFASVVDTMRADRQALLECSSRLEALRDSIIRCNRQSERYNNQVDELNGRRRSE